jgi:hypothetical protein
MLRLKAENESLQTSVRSLEEKCDLLTTYRNGNDHKSSEMVADSGSGDDSSKQLQQQHQQHEQQQQHELQQQRPVEAHLDSKVQELEEKVGNLSRELEQSRLACVTAETGLRQSASERAQERDGFTQVNR